MSNAIQQQFEEKNSILIKNFKPLTSYEYYTAMYETLEREFTYVAKEENTYRRTSDFDELLDISRFRSDIYVHPCSFFGNFVSFKTLKSLYAFTIDLDNLTPNDLNLILKFRLRKLKIQPTMIMNSGQGVHLVYVLSKPVECYHNVKTTLRAILRGLKSMFTPSANNSYIVDQKTSLIQPYRFLGSLTKAGQQTRGFQCGVKVPIEELAKWVGVEWKTPTIKEVNKVASAKNTESIVVLPNTNRAFYDHVASRIPWESFEGHRYMALTALAMIGYKCRVPREEVWEDITFLVDYFNDRDGNSKQVVQAEIKKAMSTYSPKYILMKSGVLEEYLGFEFQRSKRNGRKQADHLRIANAIKHAKQKTEKQISIEKYLYKHPSASANEIVKALGMSKPTVCKYLREIRGQKPA